jgi:hypothetical protein
LAGTGSIYASEADGLIVGPVEAIGVNRLQMDSTSPPQAGAALVGAVAAESVEIQALVDLTVDGPVTATAGTCY